MGKLESRGRHSNYPYIVGKMMQVYNDADYNLKFRTIFQYKKLIYKYIF